MTGSHPLLAHICLLLLVVVMVSGSHWLISSKQVAVVVVVAVVVSQRRRHHTTVALLNWQAIDGVEGDSSRAVVRDVGRVGQTEQGRLR